MDCHNSTQTPDSLINELVGTVYTLERCGTVAQLYLAGLADALSAMSAAFEPFGKWRGVRPIHCDSAMEATRLAQFALNCLSGLLESLATLPLSAIPVRYHLMAILHQAEEQMQSLTQSVMEFRSVCLENTKTAGKRRQSIDNILDSVRQAIIDIQAEGASLVNQIENISYGGAANHSWIN
jgi:hypothetical protein